VKLAGPAVVNVSTRQAGSEGPSPFHQFRDNNLFDQFFRDFFESFGRRESQVTSLGSGVIIDGKKGFILTNEHVVVQASEILVQTVDEQEFQARLVGSDPDNDLALLQIQTKKTLPDLPLGDSDDLMIGETVIAIGNPFGLTHTVTTGVISALNRSLRAGGRVFRDFIQIDAPINPGNSGGPLLDINGRLIGINTAIYDKAEGIGFAIPISKAKRIIQELITYGEVHPAWLGLSLQTVDANLASHFGTGDQGGAVVTQVDPNGPAADSGLARGDVIVGLDHHRVSSTDAYEDILRGYTSGNTVTIKAFRQKRAMEVKIRTSSYPMKKARDLSWDLYGLEVEDEKIQGQPVVAIKNVRRQSPAARIGLRPGDLVHQINEVETSTVEKYLRALAKYRFRQGLSAIVQRGQYAYHVTLTP